MSGQRDPPDYLNEADKQNLLDVRRKIWLGGLKGFASGTFLGASVHWAMKTYHSRYAKIYGSPLYSFGAPLLGGASLMFLAAHNAAKNNAHHIQYLSSKGNISRGKISEYEAVRLGRFESVGGARRVRSNAWIAHSTEADDDVVITREIETTFERALAVHLNSQPLSALPVSRDGYYDIDAASLSKRYFDPGGYSRKQDVNSNWKVD